jgi:putative oxidoreductase
MRAVDLRQAETTSLQEGIQGERSMQEISNSWSKSYTNHQNAALLVLRVIVAVIFFYAAYAKFPFWSGAPKWMAAWLLTVLKFLTIIEPLGATAVFVGFLTRWAACGLAIIMVGAIFVTQFVMHIGFATPTGPGWNFPLMVLAATLVLIAFGAGRWSLDASNRGRR